MPWLRPLLSCRGSLACIVSSSENTSTYPIHAPTSERTEVVVEDTGPDAIVFQVGLHNGFLIVTEEPASQHILFRLTSQDPPQDMSIQSVPSRELLSVRYPIGSDINVMCGRLGQCLAIPPALGGPRDLIGRDA